MTKIQWTQQTWNPVVGCTIDTKGCTNCYAMRSAHRMSHNPNTPQYHGTAKLVNGKPVWTGKMNLAEKAMLQPLKRKKPTMYFVNSMGDLFHEDVPNEWIDRVFAVMALCPQHTFQILTKRAARMREYCSKPRTPYAVLPTELIAENSIRAVEHWPLPNVWLGVSVEDQTTADLRIPLLLETPAAIRFVSAEPMLGPVYLTEHYNGHYFSNWLVGPQWHEGPALNAFERGRPKLDWVICGGESGPNARPMHPDWARSLRDQCVAAGVPFFFKQWGKWTPIMADEHPIMFTNKGGDVRTQVFKKDGQVMVDSRKKDYRLLDGRVWNEMPEVVA